VIKIPILVLAFQMADKGSLSLAERITIYRAGLSRRLRIFRFNDPGLQPTLRRRAAADDHHQRQTRRTDLALGKVGGVDKVNAWLDDNGYADALHLNMSTAEVVREVRRASAARHRNEKTNSDKSLLARVDDAARDGRSSNRLQRCRRYQREGDASRTQTSCADMLAMLRAQQSGDRRLPHFLNVPVGTRRATFRPRSRNDVGIVSARSGPIVIAFFANSIEGRMRAEDRIGRIAQTIVEVLRWAGRARRFLLDCPSALLTEHASVLFSRRRWPVPSHEAFIFLGVVARRLCSWLAPSRSKRTVRRAVAVEMWPGRCSLGADRREARDGLALRHVTHDHR
jgi:hypothetical protein